MRFLSTNLVGVSRTAAHVLWEPQDGLRCRVVGPEHDRPSGEGTDSVRFASTNRVSAR
jgi:hypothetical protein